MESEHDTTLKLDVREQIPTATCSKFDLKTNESTCAQSSKTHKRRTSTLSKLDVNEDKVNTYSLKILCFIHSPISKSSISSAKRNNFTFSHITVACIILAFFNNARVFFYVKTL